MPKTEMQKYDANKDYYRVLGVRREASAEEIDRAYRSQARTRHPDGGGSEDEMKSLNEAHDVLSDGETRKAYDQKRRPGPSTYVSSMAFDPEAASKAGTLGIPVSDPDFAGLVMGAMACFGLGVPLLLLVEMQWMFFLWPLRVMSLGALGVGVYLSHSALAVKQRKLRKAKPGGSRHLVVVRELLFWLIVTTMTGALLAALYLER
ncbi:MAG: DnaJ domain-containing protein [Blastocatellia bacterium]